MWVKCAEAKIRRCNQRSRFSCFSDSFLFSQLGSRKRRIKLVVDREYESSSTGEDSVPETQRGPPSLNSHGNINGGIYVAQNGSIIRTRRSVTTSGPLNTQTNTNNNLKIPSPVFSSRLAKHFKKLDKMAATLEERVPLHSPTPPPEAGCKILHTFQGSGRADPVTAANRNKTLTGVSAQQSNMSASSTSHSNSSVSSESAATKADLLRAPQMSAEKPRSTSKRGGEDREGERESMVDGSTTDDDQGLVLRGSLGCPSDRTQSDEDELWMGPWNNLHIPMTKL